MDISDTTLAALCLPWATTGGGGESEVSLSQRVSASAPPFSPFWTSSTGNLTILPVSHTEARPWTARASFKQGDFLTESNCPEQTAVASERVR